MNDELLARLIRVFREEAVQLFDDLSRRLDELPRLEGRELAVGVDDCMRLAHNLKGSASAVGFDDVATLAHTLEDAFGELRASGEAPSSDQLVDLQRAVLDLGNRCSAERGPVSDKARAAMLRSHDSPLGAAGGGSSRVAGARVPADRPGDPPTATGASLDERGASRSVRVDAGRLDHMIARAQELLSMRERLQARAEKVVTLLEDSIDANRATAKVRAEAWHGLLDRLEDIVRIDQEENLLFSRFASELAASMRQLRMLPLDDAAPGWRRTVADAAARLDKQVRITIDVGTVEVDKEILDRLRDPVMHLLRNSVDHGIESVEERFEAGKPKKGHIAIAARLDLGMVRLSISDDGRGIDLGSIARAAVVRGRFSEEAADKLTPDELVALMFEPGFSTRGEVTSVSGRGMGLAEVRQALEDLGGTVEVAAARANGGSTFHLLFPVTNLTTRGLLLRLDSAVHAIPNQAVERTVRVPREELATLDGEPVLLREGDEPLRIRWLADLVGSSASPGSEMLEVVVLATARGRLGLVVDEVLREDEFVMKRLPWNVVRLPGVTGVVPLADGSTALVLDAQQLIDQASEGMASAVSSASTRAIRRVLVVDDSLTSRTLLENVLRDAGYDVETAVDGEAGWATLEARRFDLVVSDVQMPRLDGFALTERIRRHPKLERIPVVLVTSLSDSADEARGYAVGANAYLVKERFENARLLSLIADLGRGRA